MSFNVSHVMFLLLKKFIVPIPNNPTTSRQENKIAAHITNIIEQAMDGDVEVEEIEELADEEDGDWDTEEFEPYDDYVLPSHQELKFGNKVVTREEVQQAIDYYRSTAKGTRTLNCMTIRFRWITTAKHLEKLRNYEKEKDNFKESRTNLLKVLANRLYEVVKEKLEHGFSLHDCDLKSIALHINNKETKITQFKASQSWISRWKRSHRIVSRKVTKFVTRKCLLDKDKIQKTADDFVRQSRREMSLFSPKMIFNSDQTGIQKELYGARALAFIGEKIVARLVQAKSSLTHSFTFLPMLFMNGTLGPKAFMVLAEPTGVFPPSCPIPNCPNLEVRAAKSHIMTKDSMRDWLQSCVFIPNVSKRLYMLVDSWPSFKDHVSINNCVPPGFDVTIRNIPPHTTSLIQPLDAHWNGPWKNFLKKFTIYALTFYPNYIIANRNNEIWMISLLYHQISSQYFKPFLVYSWKKTGFLDSSSPSPFLTPSQFCFEQVTDQSCYNNACTELAFIRCSRCKEFICFSHFIVDEKHLWFLIYDFCQLFKNQNQENLECGKLLENEENAEIHVQNHEKVFEYRGFCQTTISILLTFGVILVTFSPFSLDSDMFRPIATLATGFLILISDNDQKILSNRVLTYFGDISYALYLMHWPIYAYWKLTRNDDQYALFLSVIASIILSIIIHETYEKSYLQLCSTNIIMLTIILYISNLILINKDQILDRFEKMDYHSLDGVLENMTMVDAARFNHEWSINDYENLYARTCIYETAGTIFGWCRHTGLTGKYKIMTMGNSWNPNHATLLYQECGHLAQSIFQGSASGCEVLYPSIPSDIGICDSCEKNFKDFEEHLEMEKPDYLFLFTRFFTIGNPLPKNVTSFNEDPIYQVMKKQMLKFIPNISKKMYILDAMPRLKNNYIEKIVPMLSSGTPTKDLDELLIDTNLFEMARRRNAQLVKDCNGKCILVDYNPVFWNSTTQTFRFYDEKGFSYFTTGSHLTPHGIEHIRHVWRDICRKL